MGCGQSTLETRASNAPSNVVLKEDREKKKKMYVDVYHYVFIISLQEFVVVRIYYII